MDYRMYCYLNTISKQNTIGFKYFFFKFKIYK